MENKIKILITELKKENEERNKAINSINISDYNHTAKVHQYNLTLDFIKRLETL